jgi:hypothetical protein
MKRLVCVTLLAASLAPLGVAAQSPHADSLTLSVETRAQDAYQSGRDRFRTGEFSAAVDDFRRSLDLVDSPNTRMYLGRALLRLGRLPESYATLDRAASDADRRSSAEPRYAATRDSARAEADDIRRAIALVTVHVSSLPEGATLRVGGTEVPRTAVGFPLPFMPGEVIVEFDAPGFAPTREIVILLAGGDATVDLHPRAAPAALQAPTPGASQPIASRLLLAPTASRWTAPRVAGVTLLSVGAATAIAGVVFGMFAWADHQALSNQVEIDQASPLIAQGEFRRDLANVLIASGSAAAVGGLLTYLLSSRGREASPARPGVQLDVGVGASGPTLRLRGPL